ncbi:hypothetical protein EW026_g1715 [Hermanssonia centrifuga]|uniref:DUF6532 domain-containing protein n=1 Tax=Hermanssonia centrifuga TaxID=98765 RepID=A0A4S4KQI8_9APHY|nr:hypothetical protein EW026_g1715 [Hermanssonia centrifuga]
MPGTRRAQAAKPVGTSGQDSELGPEPAILPPRRSKTKAMEDQVWQRDAPKRKRKPELEDATDEAILVEHRPEQAKKRRADEKVNLRQTKDGTNSKHLPTGKGRRPVLQRELLIDEDADVGKDIPLAPKVVVTAAKRQSRQVKPDPQAALVSNNNLKKGPPVLIGKAKQSKSADDDKSAGSDGDEYSSDAQSDMDASDNNEDLTSLATHPDRLREAMVKEWAVTAESGGEDSDEHQPPAQSQSLSRRYSQASQSDGPPPSTLAATSDDEGVSAVEDNVSDTEDLFADDRKVNYASRVRVKPQSKDAVQRHGKAQMASKVMSRREQAVQKERPRFKTVTDTLSSDTSDNMIQAGRTSATVRQGRRTMETMAEWEKTWPVSTRLLYNSRIKVNIGAQSVGIQRVLKSSIEELIADFAFGTAVYPADERISAQRSVVVSVATRLAFKEIGVRLREEWEYAKEFVEVGEHRVTLLRGGIKKTVTQVLASIYGLKQGDIEGKLDKKNPFMNKLITQLLAVHFFNGPRSIASQYSNLFKSTIPERPDEKEIPEAMLGIICVAIYDGLGDWTTGTFTVASDFEVGNVEAEYLKVMDFLAEIKAKSVKMYHRIMHQVYKNVCDQRGGIANPDRKRGVAGALAQLEFDDE